MIKKYVYIIGVGSSLLLSGCGNDIALPETDTDALTPIILNATGMSVSTGEEALTRAATDFPNEGSVAIIAAKTNVEAPATVDWSTENLHLNHLSATAGVKDAESYPITFNPKQYYSFDANEYLRFAAYSPASDATMTATRTAESTLLTVSVSGGKSFPDLLYTIPTTNAYNKKTGKDGVNLGTFNHAMAKLVIKIIPVKSTASDQEIAADDNAIKDLKITELKVLTKVTEGTFNLNESTSDWTLTAPDNNAEYTTVSTLIGSPATTALPYDSEQTGKCYLFPATNDVKTVELSAIKLAIKDGSIGAIDNTYTINEFKEGTTPVKLEMGKITTLTIKVKVTTIQTGTDLTTSLEGNVKDWIYKGNSNVTIE